MNSILIITVLSLGAPGPKDAKPHPLVGTWAILTTTQNGKTREVTGQYCWTFTKDGERKGHTVDTAPTSGLKYELDEKTRPSAFVITHEYRNRPPQLEWFVFEIDGDTLTVCTRPEGRPKSITAEEGSGNSIYKLKRLKTKD